MVTASSDGRLRFRGPMGGDLTLFSDVPRLPLGERYALAFDPTGELLPWNQVPSTPRGRDLADHEVRLTLPRLEVKSEDRPRRDKVA